MSNLTYRMTDITVVLTVYKRPHTLVEQLRAVQSQTIPPREIFIWQNMAEGYSMPEIPAELMTNVSIIKSSKNFGVWARFAVSLLANTEYVCVFDDDTIPGKKWFENCLTSMAIKPGLYGAVGLRYHSMDYYSATRHGWPSCNSDIEEVDIVGHSWFFKRNMLSSLWQFTPDYTKLLTFGEDIAFSCFLQHKGIRTYVPPHPKSDLEMFGSIPATAWKYGEEDVGISRAPGVEERFRFVYRYFLENQSFQPWPFRSHT
jgi:hypothetical protein